jgi:Uma2 family endonuclease
MVKESNRWHEEEVEIPEALVYETLDDKVIPYRGFRYVLNGELNAEEIMGSSALRSYIIGIIIEFLLQTIDKKKYKILPNELGVHVDKGTNLAADIAIYEREQLINQGKLTATYIDVPPLFVIEVDTKADLVNFESLTDYFPAKTQKLLDFGVQKVVWVMTKSKKITIATPENSWITSSWDEIVSLGDEIKFSLNKLIEEDGFGEELIENQMKDDEKPS